MHHVGSSQRHGQNERIGSVQVFKTQLCLLLSETVAYSFEFRAVTIAAGIWLCRAWLRAHGQEISCPPECFMFPFAPWNRYISRRHCVWQLLNRCNKSVQMPCR